MSTTELGVIDQLIFDVGVYIADVFQRLADNIDHGFSIILQDINALIVFISESLKRTLSDLSDVIGDIFGKIEDFISTTIQQVIAFIDEILADIIAGINTLIDDTSAYLKELTEQIYDFFLELIGRASDFLQNVFDSVVESIIGIVDRAKQIFSDIFDKVVSEIQLIVDKVKLFFGDIFNTVKDGINVVIAKAGEVVRAITDAVKQFISSVVDVVGSSLRDLLETISNLPDAIKDLAGTILESAKSNIGDPLAALQEGIWAGLTKQLTAATGEDRAVIKNVMSDIMLSFNSPPQSLEEAAETYRRILPRSPVLSWIVELFAALQFMTQVTGGVAQASSVKILQGYALENPYEIMQPADAIRARHFGLIGNEEAEIIFRMHGHTAEDAVKLIETGETVPPEGEQIVWWLRELIDDAQLQSGLTKKGWSEASIGNIKQAAFFIPPVQDLITMAVREVFTPEVAARFGQFDDFPEDFAVWSKKQGVSEDWARNYWAAHWALPSVQMGFEMLHRGVIEKADLNLLLRASDVMPFWRDKIIDISFSPLTRVDIRRMHKLEVLTVEDVNKAYRDIGYSEENAQRLTDFTVQLNAPKEEDDPDDLTQLTRANIIGLFEDGVFTKETATDLLIGIGLSEASAALFVEASSLDLERQRRKDEIKIILDQAEFGSITFEEAQDALNGLGLESGEITAAITKLQKVDARRNKLPSKADLDKMVKKKIISKEIYLETLQRIGYNKTWADRLAKLL